MTKWVYSFGDGKAEGKADMRNLLGGKGANLGEMAGAGLPVPPGFVLLRDAYLESMRAAGVDRELVKLHREAIAASGDETRLGELSNRCRDLVARAGMTEAVRTELLEHYRRLGADVVVAVRSSATGEDGKDASFAGMNETLTNIAGDEDLLDAVRRQESTYKSAGSVHGCALFRGEDMLVFVEDVGRHNAIDTIAGWMWMNPEATSAAPSTQAGQTDTASFQPMGGADKVFYTTGRLTSEMVIKSAQMGVPIVVSRSGMTQMGHAVAQQLGLCAIGRATNRRFVCYSGTHRLVLQPELAQVALVPGAQAVRET
mgnify:CR=1 FL=1